MASLDHLFCIELGSCATTVESGRTYKEVLGVNLGVFGEVVVLLGHEYTLAKEVLVDLLAVGFWDKPVEISPCQSICLEMGAQ